MNAIAITPTTGKRPLLMDQCRRYVQRQTVQVPHYVVEVDQDVLHNMLKLCDLFEGTGADVAVVFEDDDWYPSTWVESVARVWREGMLAVGAPRSLYYHVPSKSYWAREHEDRAALCETAFHRSALPIMREAIHDHDHVGWRRWLVDLRFWRLVPEDQKGFTLDEDRIPIGIKGLEPGHTNQHERQPDRGQWVEDPFGDFLYRKLASSDDYRFYMEYPV